MSYKALLNFVLILVACQPPGLAEESLVKKTIVAKSNTPCRLQKMVGEVVRVANGAPGAESQQDLAYAASSILSRDEEALQSLSRRGKLYLLKQGTKVRIESFDSRSGDEFKVHVLSGDSIGRHLWMPATYVRLREGTR